MKTITIILYTSFIVALGITLFYPYIYNTVSFINTLLIPLFILSIISLCVSNISKNLFSYYKNKKTHIIIQTIMLFVLIVEIKMESSILNDEEFNKHWIETGAEVEFFFIQGYLAKELDTVWVKEYKKAANDTTLVDYFWGIAVKDTSQQRHLVFFYNSEREQRRLSCFMNYLFQLKNGDIYWLSDINIKGIDMKKKEIIPNTKGFGDITYKVNGYVQQYKAVYSNSTELYINKSN